ncbi:hypothetical protein BDZ91DRAFT_268178 [Kalaharituber pfeilii]|nr:hypothetical protein BDZ91DRAFT_268178 [Kalaharituber pfeilii]
MNLYRVMVTRIGRDGFFVSAHTSGQVVGTRLSSNFDQILSCNASYTNPSNRNGGEVRQRHSAVASGPTLQQQVASNSMSQELRRVLLPISQ